MDLCVLILLITPEPAEIMQVKIVETTTEYIIRDYNFQAIHRHVWSSRVLYCMLKFELSFSKLQSRY